MFNSFEQWEKFKPLVMNESNKISCGLRINPEFSTQEKEIYDPCAPFSRLGITRDKFTEENIAKLDGIEGFHIHTLCEQNSDALAETLEVFLDEFGEFLPNLKWLNLGGGHRLTSANYDMATLNSCIRKNP